MFVLWVMTRLKRVNDMILLDGIMKEQENTKESKETKPNSFLGSVIWRNWILPLFIGALFVLLITVVFTYFEWYMFVGGQVSILCYIIIHKISSI